VSRPTSQIAEIKLPEAYYQNQNRRVLKNQRPFRPPPKPEVKIGAFSGPREFHADDKTVSCASADGRIR
jgi:hypothetical protein